MKGLAWKSKAVCSMSRSKIPIELSFLLGSLREKHDPTADYPKQKYPKGWGANIQIFSANSALLNGDTEQFHPATISGEINQCFTDIALRYVGKKGAW